MPMFKTSLPFTDLDKKNVVINHMSDCDPKYSYAKMIFGILKHNFVVIYWIIVYASDNIAILSHGL